VDRLRLPTGATEPEASCDADNSSTDAGGAEKACPQSTGYRTGTQSKAASVLAKPLRPALHAVPGTPTDHGFEALPRRYTKAAPAGVGVMGENAQPDQGLIKTLHNRPPLPASLLR
jgi:hypothetical protein